jgi:hypothetical protein
LLQLLQSLHEPVILAVADLGLIEHVVKVLVVMQTLAKRLHLADNTTGRSCGGHTRFYFIGRRTCRGLTPREQCFGGIFSAMDAGIAASDSGPGP